MVRVLDRLDEDGVPLCVAGGWGVDALAAVDTLAGLGYVPETDWLPVRLEVAAAGRGWVDLHPVEVAADGHGVQRGPDGTTYE